MNNITEAPAIPAELLEQNFTESSPYQLPPDDVAAIDELGKIYQALRAELGKTIIGQDEVIEKLAICLFARGHA